MAARRKPVLYRADQRAAEIAFGRQPGRPTVSRHVGRLLGGALGTTEHRGVALFHAGLFAGIVAVLLHPATRPEARLAARAKQAGKG